MPLPFSHIYYANKIKEKILQDKNIDEQDFFIGSTFPDIRHIIKKEKKFTHLNFKNSDEILEKIKKENDSFELGILCHLYTDYKFNEYWIEKFDEFKNNQKVYYAILLLDNEIMFDKFGKNDILKAVSYFDKTNFNKYHANQEQIKKWHDIIKKILPTKINREVFKFFAIKTSGASEDLFNQIMNVYNKIKDNQEIINKIENFEKELN